MREPTVGQEGGSGLKPHKGPVARAIYHGAMLMGSARQQCLRVRAPLPQGTSLFSLKGGQRPEGGVSLEGSQTGGLRRDG